MASTRSLCVLGGGKGKQHERWRGRDVSEEMGIVTHSCCVVFCSVVCVRDVVIGARAMLCCTWRACVCAS